MRMSLSKSRGEIEDCLECGRVGFHVMAFSNLVTCGGDLLCGLTSSDLLISMFECR